MPNSTRSTAARSVAVCLILILISACSQASGSGSTATSRPDDLVLVRASASQGWEGDKCISDLQTNVMVYDTLLRIKTPNGDGVAPGLAESYSYDSAKNQYTFTLRRAARFSNGNPVTAADVVFSMDQWRSGSVSGSYYATIQSEAVVSDNVLTVQMTQPDTFLPNLLTWCTSTIYPKDFAGESADDFFKKPVGAGAYQVVSSQSLTGPNEVLSLKPNPYFYGWTKTNKGIKSVAVKTIADASQRAVQFKAGDIDIIEGVDSATEASIGADVVKRAKPDALYGVLANMKTGPTTDPKLRAAIAMAIDRSALAAALADGSEPATGMLPVNVPGSTAPTTPYAYDLAGAKELMASSQTPNGVTLSYLYDASDKSADVAAQIMQSQLKKVGIALKLETTDGNTLYSRQGKSDFQLTSTGASAISPTIFDPISYYQAAAYPYSGADMTVIDEQFLIGTSTTDLTAQVAAARAVQDDALEQNALIGVYTGRASWAVQPWLRGFTTLQYGLFYLDTVVIT